MAEYRVGRGAVIDWGLQPAGHPAPTAPEPRGRWEIVARGMGRVLSHFGPVRLSTGIPVLSLPTAFNLTATTATPRVTVTF